MYIVHMEDKIAGTLGIINFVGGTPKKYPIREEDTVYSHAVVAMAKTHQVYCIVVTHHVFILAFYAGQYK